MIYDLEMCKVVKEKKLDSDFHLQCVSVRVRSLECVMCIQVRVEGMCVGGVKLGWVGEGGGEGGGKEAEH
jgi:hypothetical protein